MQVSKILAMLLERVNSCISARHLFRSVYGALSRYAICNGARFASISSNLQICFSVTNGM